MKIIALRMADSRDLSTNKPRHEKTNNVVSQQVQHKPISTLSSTEDGQSLEMLDLES